MLLTSHTKLAKQLKRVAVAPSVATLALDEYMPDISASSGWSDEIELSDVTFPGNSPQEIDIYNKPICQENGCHKILEGPTAPCCTDRWPSEAPPQTIEVGGSAGVIVRVGSSSWP
jgi:hypothetical protein